MMNYQSISWRLLGLVIAALLALSGCSAEMQPSADANGGSRPKTTAQLTDDSSAEPQASASETESTATEKTSKSSTVPEKPPATTSVPKQTTTAPRTTAAPKTTPAPKTQAPTTAAVSVGTYQSILDEYTVKLREASPRLAEEYKQEAVGNTGGLQGLSKLYSEKVSELSAIHVEGISKMAKIRYQTGSGKLSEYQEWAGKLQEVYMEEAKKLSAAYLEAAK